MERGSKRDTKLRRGRPPTEREIKRQSGGRGSGLGFIPRAHCCVMETRLWNGGSQAGLGSGGPSRVHPTSLLEASLAASSERCWFVLVHLCTAASIPPPNNPLRG